MIPYGFGVHVFLRSHILSPTTRVLLESHCLTAQATLQSFSDPNALRVCPPALLDGQAAILTLLHKVLILIRIKFKQIRAITSINLKISVPFHYRLNTEVTCPKSKKTLTNCQGLLNHLFVCSFSL